VNHDPTGSEPSATNSVGKVIEKVAGVGKIMSVSLSEAIDPVGIPDVSDTTVIRALIPNLARGNDAERGAGEAKIDRCAVGFGTDDPTVTGSTYSTDPTNGDGSTTPVLIPASWTRMFIRGERIANDAPHEGAPTDIPTLDEGTDALTDALPMVAFMAIEGPNGAALTERPVTRH
jgi:hypothetical protein